MEFTVGVFSIYSNCKKINAHLCSFVDHPNKAFRSIICLSLKEQTVILEVSGIYKVKCKIPVVFFHLPPISKEQHKRQLWGFFLFFFVFFNKLMFFIITLTVTHHTSSRPRFRVGLHDLRYHLRKSLIMPCDAS